MHLNNNIFFNTYDDMLFNVKGKHFPEINSDLEAFQAVDAKILCLLRWGFLVCYLDVLGIYGKMLEGNKGERGIGINITGTLPPTGNLKPNLKASASLFSHAKSTQSVNTCDINTCQIWLQEKDRHFIWRHI